MAVEEGAVGRIGHCGGPPEIPDEIIHRTQFGVACPAGTERIIHRATATCARLAGSTSRIGVKVDLSAPRVAKIEVFPKNPIVPRAGMRQQMMGSQQPMSVNEYVIAPLLGAPARR